LLWFKSIVNAGLMLIKGTVSPVYNCLKVILLKSLWSRHIAPDIKNRFNCLLIYYWAFEVLMLRQNHSYYYFSFECAERLLYAHQKLDRSCSIFIINVESAALCPHEQKYLEPVFVHKFSLCLHNISRAAPAIS
jgi:hypothetical protein